MSYVRITEFAAPQPRQAGEWYAAQSPERGVRVQRSGAEPPPDPARETGRVLTRWDGVRICRWGSAKKGSLLFLLKYPVPLDYLDEFDAWFRYEHMPMLLEESTWYGCEFYRSLGASGYPYAALHQLEPQALKSPARDRSIDTPWWHRLKQHDWFDKQFVRMQLTPL